MSEITRRYSGDAFTKQKHQLALSGNEGKLKECTDVIQVAKRELERTAREWATELSPWDNIIEQSRRFFGEQWVHFCLANVSSAIKSRELTCKEYPDLLDHSKSLCKRTRYARLRAGNHRWWSEQFKEEDSEMERCFILLLLLTWGSKKTLLKLLDTITCKLDNLTPVWWLQLADALKHITNVSREQINRKYLTLNAGEG
jgi:hypothetical protein